MLKYTYYLVPGAQRQGPLLYERICHPGPDSVSLTNILRSLPGASSEYPGCTYARAPQSEVPDKWNVPVNIYCGGRVRYIQ